MHITKALGQTIILLVRVVWEESGTYFSTFEHIFWQQYWFFVSLGRNTPGFLYKCVPCMLFIQYITHTFKWMHFPITSAKQKYGICRLPLNSQSFISVPVWTWPTSFSQKLLCCWYSPILFPQHFQPLAASCLKEGSWTAKAPVDLLRQGHWTQSLS